MFVNIFNSALASVVIAIVGMSVSLSVYFTRPKLGSRILHRRIAQGLYSWHSKVHPEIRKDSSGARALNESAVLKVSYILFNCAVLCLIGE